LLSLAFHVLLIALLVTPLAVRNAIVERDQGAGGLGPAGGGGGGHRGTGGSTSDATEQLRYVQLAPPATVQSSPPEIVLPKVVPPIEPPKVEPLPAPKVEVKDVPVPAKLPDVAATPGAGGGSGHDGTNGSGPGSGGGVGSGIGTGRGSGVGPGTGGGVQENYPPTPTELFMPPFPMPDRVRGFHLVAEYDIDESGRILSFDFTHTKDRDYNKRLEEVLKSFRFRPGTRPDGTPIRMKAQIIYDF
jgi:protein TonB